MTMTRSTILFGAALLTTAAMNVLPLHAAPVADLGQGVESMKQRSAVRVAMEPTLSQGRVIIKVAAMNRTAEPIAFGPQNLALTEVDGDMVGWTSFDSLVRDVLVANGIELDAPASSQLPASYSTPTMHLNSSGELDVAGFTGTMGVGSNYRSHHMEELKRKQIKPKILAKIDQQVGDLEAAILQPSEVQSGEVAAGQVVSRELDFDRKEDRRLLLTIELAGETHEFEFVPPEK